MEKYLVILIIVILFYLYKYCIQIDNFGDTPVLDAALVNSIKTLGVIATDLQTDGLKVMGEIVLQNKHVLKSAGASVASATTPATPATLELREKPSNNLASMKVDGLEVTGTCNLIPRGMILAWNYTDADKNAAGVVTPPSGWAICDGTTVGGVTTPDLKGRFILGEDATVIRNSRTGGQETVTLTTNQIPSHTHGYDVAASAIKAGAAGMSKADVYSNTVSGTTGAVGGGLSHDNMPPYYVLVYIMKL